MKFREPSAFEGGEGYALLPFRFRRLPFDRSRVLVSNLAGDWMTCDHSELEQLIRGTLDPSHPIVADALGRFLVIGNADRSSLAPLISQMRTRKGYLASGPRLHIFVVSLRCHHTCTYCQVSRRPVGDSSFDMGGRAGAMAVERLFEWPSKDLTIEFQGGEPLLNFDRVRALTTAIVERNKTEGRRLRFVIASTLHDLTADQLAFMKEHDFALSTSLDGPDWLHNANRPRPEKDSHRRTVEGIDRGRRILGDDAVSALTTLTRKSLDHPVAIIDEYKKHGFHLISLRPLSPYGFAIKTKDRSGYPMADFVRFYRTALDHLLTVNQGGFAMVETYGQLLLSQLMTPFSHGYVDLRSPTGAGLGAVVYDFDGRVYPSDEARMLAAMGDASFALGTVNDTVETWMASPAMARIMRAGVAETLPTCSDCAYVPLCGADPVDHYARQQDTIGHRPTSPFCTRQMGLFDLFVEQLETGSDAMKDMLEGWGLSRPAVLEDAA
ncbi:His-Xaa-Ser system radical SAM maturase HxsB [Luteibacter sp. HA06]